MTYYNAPRIKNRKRTTVLKFIGGLLMGLFIFFVGVATGSATAGPGNTSSPGFVVGQSVAAAVSSAPVSSPATKAPAAKPKATTKPPAPKPTIAADAIVHVGEDVPAGTYRADTDVRGMDCYWSKTNDAEGVDIIANALPSGGRPQVTLKKGQWFSSERCGSWTHK